MKKVYFTCTPEDHSKLFSQVCFVRGLGVRLIHAIDLIEKSKENDNIAAILWGVEFSVHPVITVYTSLAEHQAHANSYIFFMSVSWRVVFDHNMIKSIHIHISLEYAFAWIFSAQLLVAKNISALNVGSRNSGQKFQSRRTQVSIYIYFEYFRVYYKLQSVYLYLFWIFYGFFQASKAPNIVQNFIFFNYILDYFKPSFGETPKTNQCDF